MADDALLTLTADIVAAHVAHNEVSTAALPELITAVYGALRKLGAPQEPELTTLIPAVPIRSSVKSDYIVCLEDGKKLTMLKRYIGRRYDLTPDQYRAKWGLPADYPMVSPNYADKRRALAKEIGLGKRASALSEEKPAGSARKKIGIVQAK